MSRQHRPYSDFVIAMTDALPTCYRSNRRRRPSANGKSESIVLHWKGTLSYTYSINIFVSVSTLTAFCYFTRFATSGSSNHVKAESQLQYARFGHMAMARLVNLGQVSAWQSTTLLPISCKWVQPVPAWVEEPVNQVRQILLLSVLFIMNTFFKLPR